MKVDNALIAALIAIGFFTCEVHAREYVLKLSKDQKVEMSETLVKHRNVVISKDQPWDQPPKGIQ